MKTVSCHDVISIFAWLIVNSLTRSNISLFIGDMLFNFLILWILYSQIVKSL